MKKSKILKIYKRGLAFFVGILFLCSNSMSLYAEEKRDEENVISMEQEQQELKQDLVPELETEVNTSDYESQVLPMKEETSVTYNTHIQTTGWQDWKEDGEISGSIGKGKRLEAIQIALSGIEYLGNIQYRVHIQNIGWQDWKQNGEMAGTTGKSFRLEAIEIKLTDQLAEEFNVMYRVHVQNIGWLDWAKNGETTGTAGYGYRLEAIEIKLVPKENHDNEQNGEIFYQKLVSYQAHIQQKGNQDYVWDGETAGTDGQGLRMEALRIKLPSLPNSSVEYRVHIQGIGWQGWKKDNELAGTIGQSRRIEAIEVRLTGEISKEYDVYYRVHCQQFGWLDWAKNGESAGTAGYGYRMEGIQIELLAKNTNGPNGQGNAFEQKMVTYQAHVQGMGNQNAVSDGQLAGTEGKSLRLEGLKIGLPAMTDSHISYRSYVQDEGWQDWKSDMQLSGTTGQSKGIEVIQIQLSGSAASEYDIYYRVHVANLGWLGWTKNGEKAGSRFYNSSIEAIQIQMLKKGDNSITIGESYKEGIQNGIDVSEYNGDINWSQVKKSRVSFAMLRCVKGSNPNNISVDAKFNQNIKGASDNGISVGVYRYSYADTASEARKEAMAVVNAIQNSGYRIQYPIAYDIEDENVQGDLSKAQLTEIIKIFKGIVENHGYKFMIYANKNWLDNKIDMNSFEDEDVWIARYRDYTPSLGHGYTGAGNVTIWQYSDRGTVPGIQGAVDMNIGYKEY